MAQKWGQIGLSGIIPTDVLSTISGVGDVVSKIAAQMQNSFEVAKAQAQETEAPPSTDLLATVVNGLVSGIETLLQSGKIHVMFVPIPRAVPNGPPSITTPSSLTNYLASLGVSWEATNIAFSSTTASQSTNNLAGSNISGADSSYASLMAGSSGGNNGFYKTITQALLSDEDPNRPAYEDPTSYVAGAILLAGSTSFVGTVKSASSMDAIFKPDSGSMTRSTIPVPQNVTVKAIALPQNQQMGIRVDWDAPDDTFESTYFPGVSMRIKSYAVIRSTDSSSRNSQNVIDLMGTADLNEGAVNNTATVVSIDDGDINTFIDSGLDLTLDYTYCVAWKVIVTEGGQDTELPWDLVSATRKINIRRLPPNRRSAPPDWSTYGSTLDLLPDAANAINSALGSLKARAAGSSPSATTTALTALETNMTDMISQITETSNKILALTNALSSAPSVYATTFNGVGGNAFLLGELALRLTDTTDTSRPPYDGNEYVIGVMIVAGGPREADIAPIIALLGSLLGTVPTSQTSESVQFTNVPVGLSSVPQTPNQTGLAGVLATLEPVLAQAEAVVFGDNLKPLPTSTAVATTATSTTTNTTFATDGTPIPANSPSNPAAGQTGLPTC